MPQLPTKKNSTKLNCDFIFLIVKYKIHFKRVNYSGSSEEW